MSAVDTVCRTFTTAKHCPVQQTVTSLSSETSLSLLSAELALFGLPWKAPPGSIRAQCNSINREAGGMRNGTSRRKMSLQPASAVKSGAELKCSVATAGPDLAYPQGPAVKVPGPHRPFLWNLPVQCHQAGLDRRPRGQGSIRVRFLKCHVWDAIWHCLYIDLAPLLLTTRQELKALLLELKCVNF